MSAENRKKLVILSGGGTGGPSTVPLALGQALRRKDKDINFIFVGSNPSLEKKLFAQIFKELTIEYKVFPAGKWRRYFTWQNFFDVFRVLYAFVLAYIWFKKVKPDLFISAGSFASVPLAWAAKLRGIKIVIHQQDLRPGLANRLMAKTADLISTAFEQSVKDYGRKAIWLGNPLLQEQLSQDLSSQLLQELNLKKEEPVLLLVGGASGAIALNKLLVEALSFLPSNWQIIHQTGSGKTIAVSRLNYYQFETLAHEDFHALLNRADIVLSRAGLGSLTEFSALAKTVVLIPMPQTHKEDNAQYFALKKAALYWPQAELTGEVLAHKLLSLWHDKEQRRMLQENIKQLMPLQAATNGASLIYKLIYES